VDTFETEIIYASAAEHEQIGVDSCEDASLPAKTITGTVSGVASGQYGVVSLGTATAIFDGASATNPVTLHDVPAGPVDLIATRITNPGMPPDKVIVLRNLDLPDGGELPVTVDYDGTAALVPASATATVTGGGADSLEIFTELVTPNGASLMWFDLAPSNVSARPWAGLPPSALLNGEYHTIVVFANAAASHPGDYRVAFKYVGPVVNHTIALGAPVSAPSVSAVVTAPAPRFRFRGSITADYDKGIYLDLRHASGNGWGITATRAWLAASGSATAYDIWMPDLSALAGFPGEARLTPGQNELLFVAYGFTGGSGIFDLEPTLGGESRAAEKHAVITVP
jgi:hypothetical protein